MNLNTLTTLLETYGTVESNWPVAVRAEARQYLAANEDARQLLKRYVPLDIALEKYVVDPNTARIRATLLVAIGRRNIIDRMTAWLLPERGLLHSFWRPTLAASLPLILGIVLGSTLSIGNTNTTPDAWNDQLSLVSLSDNDSGPLL